MNRRLLAVLLAVIGLSVTPLAVSADERAPSRKPAITLEVASTGMAAVRQPFRVAATPPPKAEGVTAVLQVQTADGYVVHQALQLDSRGRASGLVVSNKAAVRTYRAVLLSKRGRVLASSAPVTITWAPLRHQVTLTCSSSSAPIGVDIPCTITVTPAVKLDRMITSLQVMGRTGWVPLEAVRVPQDGVISTDVAGIEAGTGMYRALLLRDAKVIAESPTIPIAYTTP